MSLIIFFGMALGIFVLGVVAIVVTLYRWKVEAREKKAALVKTQNKTISNAH